MAIEFAPFDAADYLKSEEDCLALLNDAFATGHKGYILKALGAVARYKGGLTALERKTKIKRQTLNKALSEAGNPTFETVIPVMAAMGMRLAAVHDETSEFEAESAPAPAIVAA